MITLVLGGVRSGKSAIAESLVADHGEVVTYVASGKTDDETLTDRIAKHRARRPQTWRTVEVDPGPALAALIAEASTPLLIDSTGSWLALHHDFDADVDALVGALATATVPIVVVGEEVGLSVHPQTALGRAFQDALGALNHAIADVSDTVFLAVAGRVLPLPTVDEVARNAGDNRK